MSRKELFDAKTGKPQHYLKNSVRLNKNSNSKIGDDVDEDEEPPVDIEKIVKQHKQWSTSTTPKSLPTKNPRSQVEIQKKDPPKTEVVHTTPSPTPGTVQGSTDKIVSHDDLVAEEELRVALPNPSHHKLSGELKTIQLAGLEIDCWDAALQINAHVKLCPFVFTSETSQALPKQPTTEFPTPFTGNGLAISTQLTINRISRLVDTLHRWQGHISAALFLKNQAEAGSTLQKLTELYDKDALVTKYLDIHIVLNDPTNRDKYPINFLRNVAMEYCAYRWTFIVDADARPSGTSAQYMASVSKALKAKELDAATDVSKESLIKNVFIVPAFEFTAKVPITKQEGQDFPTNKSTLRQMARKSIVQPMHIQKYAKAYKPTNYPRWYRVEEAYHIPYKLYFEPYYITRLGKHFPPRYDERFYNFGINKAQQLFEVMAAGYTLNVLPDQFLIDIGQPKSWKKEFKPTTMHNMFNKFKAEIEKRYNIKYDDTDLVSWVNSLGRH
eukprot:CAMPEP_0168522044 /NCGR_PEP_ID=MMETSP0405-20121227/9053_1 /TAXON_ID=498012 /ORGANISM="Trichosphaerium sp, Strain Am-I-7 wt" /LENGTH=497 /DNA_ID=CAMNT_0008543451 /DNA_START=361 /DNA_END=1854 /DNA_ORIENTATION=+